MLPTVNKLWDDLRLPKKNSANGQKYFSFRGAKLWNSHPAEAKTASSLNGFKKSIKGQLFLSVANTVLL